MKKGLDRQLSGVHTSYRRHSGLTNWPVGSWTTLQIQIVWRFSMVKSASRKASVLPMPSEGVPPSPILPYTRSLLHAFLFTPIIPSRNRTDSYSRFSRSRKLRSPVSLTIINI